MSAEESNSIPKQVDSANNGNREMQFSLLDDGDDGEYSCISDVEISKQLLT